MEDILTPTSDKTAKRSFVLCIIAAFLAIFFFIALQNIAARGGRTAVPLVGGIICTAVALLFGAISLIRFLRSRSIATGLFITTTVATLVYSIASRMTVFRGNSAAAPYNAVTPLAATSTGTGTNGNFWGQITLVQIGLFAVWFLFILFTIYIYIRPIRKIDFLLTQILEGREVRKPRVGKSVQYKNIECKLKALADEKYRREVQRTNRLQKSRERAKKERELIQKLLEEKEKLPPVTDNIGAETTEE
jgi:sensor histidine kinase YesM